jgi:hypothetical protein
VTSNAATTTVSLSGTGGTPSASLAPATASFGYGKVGATGTPRTFTLTNTGAVAATVSNVTLGGTNPGDFAIVADACTGASIAASGSCAVQVAFAPTVAGTRTATLSVSTNAGTKSSALSGTGDATAPSSTITAPPLGVVLPTQALTGTSTDDLSGVVSVRVTFTPLLVTSLTPVTTVDATLSCDGTGRLCDWSAPAPLLPGGYGVTVRATDAVGNLEFPGVSSSVVV